MTGKQAEGKAANAGTRSEAVSRFVGLLILISNYKGLIDATAEQAVATSLIKVGSGSPFRAFHGF